MTKISLVAAATLFALACVLPSTSAGAATGRSAQPPLLRQVRVQLPLPSMSAEQVAIAVSLSVNQYGPVQAAKAVPNGVGDWIVWARYKDNDLWLCNGHGEEAIALMQVAHTPSELTELKGPSVSAPSRSPSHTARPSLTVGTRREASTLRPAAAEILLIS